MPTYPSLISSSVDLSGVPIWVNSFLVIPNFLLRLAIRQWRICLFMGNIIFNCCSVLLIDSRSPTYFINDIFFPARLKPFQSPHDYDCCGASINTLSGKVKKSPSSPKNLLGWTLIIVEAMLLE